MTLANTDSIGLAISGATPRSQEAYERAHAAFLGWRRGIETPLAEAVQEAPGFVMAHVLDAWRLLGSRDRSATQLARPLALRAAALPANPRERMHVEAIGAVLADDYEGARRRLGELLKRHPRDALALQVAHTLDHLVGDTKMLLGRVAAVLPAWSPSMPGYYAVRAMHAFGLLESGHYARAETAALEVLAHDPLDPRTHHTMAHLFEMTERAEAGVRWMSQHTVAWGQGSVAAVHCWWHLALFQLARGHHDSVFQLYDQRLRHENSTKVADLIDASSLLWRAELAGADAASRWPSLAEAWAPHIDDAFCSFSDMHAMMAFVGARDWGRAYRLEAVLLAARNAPTRHGASTRRLGLPVCQALIAYGLGKDSRAIKVLGSLAGHAHRLGGSHAQRDVLHLTLRSAVDRVRRPVAKWWPLKLCVNAAQRAPAVPTLAMPAAAG
ncbi:MAG: tetratricopeptide repeat protein [Proteobacteria bacterium]|nr:tetratricopeptide repeat protein [Pseudomonadota bacterium]